VRNAVRRYVENAVASIDPRRFNQEGAYIAALARQLEGIAYKGSDGTIEFQSTVVDDRGPNAAEKWSGADLAITAEISDRSVRVRKAILLQAKSGDLANLRGKEAERLREQIGRMRRLTRSPKIMDLPRYGTGDSTRAAPGIYSGRAYEARGRPRRYRLGDYIIQRVLTTLDGDTRPHFVDGVEESRLSKLKVIARRYANPT
jgi:hypothetical protein